MIKEIKEMLDDNGYTINKVATFLNTAPETVSRWFNGKYIPSQGKITKMAKLFRVDEIILTNIFKGE